MTCIVGLVHGKDVYIGADTAGVAGLKLYRRQDSKIYENGPFLFGFTSSFRMGQLLGYSFKPPKQPAKMTDDKFMRTLFIDAIRDCFDEGGFMGHDKDGTEAGGTFLVGYKGRLYMIGGDYQVGEDMQGYSAVGCGDEIALGSMFSTEHMPPEKRIEQALKAAEEYSAGVRGPFNIVKQKRYKE